MLKIQSKNLFMYNFLVKQKSPAQSNSTEPDGVALTFFTISIEGQ